MEVFDRQEYAQPDDLTVHTLRYTLEAEARLVAFYIEQVIESVGSLGEVEVDGILGGGQPAEGDPRTKSISLRFLIFHKRFT